MSSFSEDVSISQQHFSNNSSSITDSLTAKLDNILHSSDDILVQNSEFFKPSSNELTEQEDVQGLPQAENNSVPRLEIEERNRKKYKSGESYTSLGTVIRHETPNVHCKQRKRPASAKPRSLTRSKNSEILKILKKITKKNPDFKKVVKKDKEIEEFFDRKIKEFELVLKNSAIEGNGQGVNLANSKIRGKNREKWKKIDEIQEKMRESELSKLQTAFCDFEESCKQRLKLFIDKSLKKYKSLKLVEDQKYEKESKNLRKHQKQVIIDNIRKYYDDKIQIFKEKIEERKMANALNNYEHKIVFSEARKCRRQQHHISHEHSIAMIKQKMLSVKQEMEDQEHSIKTKILQLYKNSTKSMKKF